MGLRKEKTLLEHAEEYVEAAIDQARDFVQDTARPAIADAKEKAAPVVAAGAATLVEKASEARDMAVPVVAAGAATIAEKATEAKEYAESKAADLNGSSKPKKRSKFKMLLLLGAIGGAIAVVARKLQGSSGDDGGWQSSYDPAPPPSPASSVPPPVETVPEAGDDSQADLEGDPLTDPLDPMPESKN